MRRGIRFSQPVLLSLSLTLGAASFWGCASGSGSTGTGGSSSTSTTTTTGLGGTGINFDGGTGGEEEDAGHCTSTSAAAQQIPLDIVFVIDRSASMSGLKWQSTTSALNQFFNDPASIGVGAGLVIFPNDKPLTCDPADYKTLDVPIAKLPTNAFALSNALPADAIGNSTPTYGALKGALQAATAYQDAHPDHKVIVVLATDGDPNSCGLTTIDEVAGQAKLARNYNGVLTYVIGVAGSIIANLDKVALAGGTGAAYDITFDVTQFFAKIEEIRNSALGCEFTLPPPPNGETLDPNRVNFSYTPQGQGAAKVLLRADDIVDCGGDPGWYYDNNAAPTKIVLCPASCATVQADPNAKVTALFGCESLVN
jgi:hypothetical protein